MSDILLKTDLQDALPLFYQGKVRDIYKVGGDRLLMVATDRISAFDVVMPNGVLDKGRFLTAISAFWFQWIEKNLPQIETHFITADWEEILTYTPRLAEFEDQLKGRSTLVWKMEQMIPVEGVVRGYLYGSGWRDYQETGETSGVKLPTGLRQADKLPEPIFTPATKAVEGHDENLPLAVMIERGLVSQAEARTVETLSLQLYQAIGTLAEADKNVIIADTKFEFGTRGYGVELTDEALTPDSSRIWPLNLWQPGSPQEDWCLDKEYVRRYLLGLVSQGKWDKAPPGPKLPSEIVEECRKRYQQYHDLLLSF